MANQTRENGPKIKVFIEVYSNTNEEFHTSFWQIDRFILDLFRKFFSKERIEIIFIDALSSEDWEFGLSVAQNINKMALTVYVYGQQR